MKKRVGVLAAALLAALCLWGCGNREPPPPPDLTGRWVQSGEATGYYQRGTITEDTISIYWYDVESDTTRLYWAGTFIPPETGEEPYVWESVNDLKRAHRSNMALRDETKTFTYEKGKISYTTNLGRFKMVISLEKVEEDGETP